jgi:hypothetical protein
MWSERPSVRRSPGYDLDLVVWTRRKKSSGLFRRLEGRQDTPAASRLVLIKNSVHRRPLLASVIPFTRNCMAADIAGRSRKDQGRGTGELQRHLFGDDLALSACPNVRSGIVHNQTSIGHILVM